MKKVFAITTVFIYLAFSCGVIVNMHYCMNRLQSVDFYASQKNECSKCGMPANKKHGCCRDEVKIVKLQNDQNKSQVSYSFKNISVAINVPSAFIIASTLTQNNRLNTTDHAPPLLDKQQTHLLNCVFRI